MSTPIDAPFPHIFRPLTVRGVYLKLSAALAPVLLFGMWRGGMSAVMVFVVTIATGALSEFLVDLFNPGTAGVNSTRNGRVLYLMALLAVLLPADTSPVIVAVAAASSIIVGIHLLGDTGVYYVHPVFIGLLVVAGSGVNTVPLLEPVAIGSLSDTVAGSVAYQVLTDTVFVPMGMRVPPEAIALLVNIGDIGAVSLGAALLPVLLVGALVVFGEDLVPLTLVVSFLVGVVAVLLVSDVDTIDLLVRSNVLVVLVFGLADPSVRPFRRTGMLFFGVLSGVISALLLITDAASLPVVSGVVLAATLRPLIDILTGKR